MALTLTKEEKNSINKILDKYHKINQEYDDYVNELQLIQTKITELEITLNDIKSEEDILMNSLKEKYGDFTLMELHEVLNKR